jgi:hypothetical protein
MTSTRPRLGLTGALVLVGLISGLPRAEARSIGLVSYPITDVWPSAVRFLRIDRNCTIREKDEASGYILFDYPDGQKVYKGSIEFIKTSDSEGRDVTRVVVSLADLPRHFELLLMDKLAVKLREDRGSPAPAPPPRKPQEPDAGGR